MAKKKAENVEDDFSPAPPADSVNGIKALDVLSSKGQKIRTYSFAEHGERFIQLAEGYAGKVKGSVQRSK